MQIELNSKECLLISNLLERERRAIESGIKKQKKDIVTFQYPIIRTSEEEARKIVREIAPLFSVFYRASHYGK